MNTDLEILQAMKSKLFHSSNKFHFIKNKILARKPKNRLSRKEMPFLANMSLATLAGKLRPSILSES